MRSIVLSLALLAAMAVGVSACGDSAGTDPALAAPARIVRLDSALLADAPQAAADYPQAVATLLAMAALPDTAVAAYVATPAFERFAHDIQAYLPPLDSVERALGATMAAVDVVLADTVATTLYGVATPYAQSIINTEAGLMVALNHYLGPSYPGYAAMPEYQRRTKTLARLPYDVAEARLRLAYPRQASTVLEAMLYEGAITSAVMQTVPDADLVTALGWTPEQLAWAQANEAAAWRALAERRLLYDTSATTIERLTYPAPTTTLLHPQAPGALGRYIGYKIVLAYLEGNADTPAAALLQPTFYTAPTTLQAAGYRP